MHVHTYISEWPPGRCWAVCIYNYCWVLIDLSQSLFNVCLFVLFTILFTYLFTSKLLKIHREWNGSDTQLLLHFDWSIPSLFYVFFFLFFFLFICLLFHCYKSTENGMVLKNNSCWVLIDPSEASLILFVYLFVCLFTSIVIDPWRMEWFWHTTPAKFWLTQPKFVCLFVCLFTCCMEWSWHTSPDAFWLIHFVYLFTYLFTCLFLCLPLDCCRSTENGMVLTHNSCCILIDPSPTLFNICLFTYLFLCLPLDCCRSTENGIVLTHNSCWVLIDPSQVIRLRMPLPVATKMSSRKQHRLQHEKCTQIQR